MFGVLIGNFRIKIQFLFENSIQQNGSRNNEGGCIFGELNCKYFSIFVKCHLQHIYIFRNRQSMKLSENPNALNNQLEINFQLKTESEIQLEKDARFRNGDLEFMMTFSLLLPFYLIFERPKNAAF